MSRRPWPLLLAALAAAGCGGDRPIAPNASPETPAAPAPVPATAAPAPGEAIFIDRAAAAGLDFVHFNGMSGEHYFNEMVGGGAALFDYDNDGDLDLYLVQGAMLGRGKTIDDALFPPRHPLPLTDRLYRNDLEVGAGGERRLRFVDVTVESGIEAFGYGMGVAAADYDNDGWIDLYVTNDGSNQMWHNDGPGGGGTVTFSDVTERTGTDDRRWSVPAVFFDYDRDGWLDLYVANYVDFTVATHKVCRAETGAATYCGPLAFKPLPDSLFRNLGDGRGDGPTFANAYAAARVDGEYGGALGAVAADFDGDGWIDLYVANDGVPNQLWMNQGDGTFKNEALLAGVAVNRQGDPEASMGVDAGDFDGDGDEDLFLAHLDKETNTLYVNDGRGMFEDLSTESGLGMPSWEATGFGASWLDYDNDGWLDLLTVNGAVVDLVSQVRLGDPYPLHQVNQLYRNRGTDAAGARFEEVGARAGAAFELSEVSRGVAVGDVDNDGDADVVIVNNNGPVRLLVNQVGGARHWLGLRLLGADVDRDMLGARVGVFRPQGPALWRMARTDGSYASASDPRVLVGLGDSPEVDRVVVRWPDGGAEEWRGLAADRYHVLRQGTGTAVE